jgi:hypothetical protein
VVLAGQAFNEASEYSHARYAWQVRSSAADPDAVHPEWVGRLQAFEPWRVLFAHDEAIWEAPAPRR